MEQGLLVARMAIVGVFLLAAAEKASTLRGGGARWNPVLLALPRMREHASAVLTASFTIDLIAVALLFRQPRVGAILCLFLLAVYTAAGLSAASLWRDGDGCGCMGRFIETRTRVGFLFRNISLAVFLLGLAFMTPSPVGLSALSALLGLVSLAILSVLISAIDRRVLDRATASSRVLPTGVGLPR
ncbi:MAG: hypothetical protein GY788_23610 [bacterium]|nr:hypothetical protein [bacterium]